MRHMGAIQQLFQELQDFTGGCETVGVELTLDKNWRFTWFVGAVWGYPGVVSLELYSQEAKHSTLPRALGVFWVGRCRCLCWCVALLIKKGERTGTPQQHLRGSE